MHSSTGEKGRKDIGEFLFVQSRGGRKPNPRTLTAIRSRAMLGRNRTKVKVDDEQENNRDSSTSPKLNKHPKKKQVQKPPLEIFLKKSYTAILKDSRQAFDGIRFADSSVSPASIFDIMQFYFFGKRSMYNLGPLLHVDPNDQVWIEPLTFDPLYLHAMAFASQAFFSLAFRQGFETKHDVWMHLDRTIQLLRERLLLPEEALKISGPPTARAILGLAVHARLTGDHRSAKHHMGGIGVMVHATGGISSYRQSGYLMMELFRNDLGLALDLGSRPVFFQDPWAQPFLHFPDLSLPLGAENVYNSRGTDMHSCKSLLTGIHPGLKMIWEVLERFCVLTHLASASNYRLPKSTLHDTMGSTMYRLLAMHFKSGSIDEAIRLGLLAFSANTFLQWETIQVSHASLSSSFKKCLLELQIEDNGLHRLVFWLLMIGAISTFTDDDDSWIKPWLGVNIRICKLSSWPMARKLLRGFLWIGMLHDQPGERLFHSLIS
ncbi:hypothetical protein BX600DRAFT_467503 [Xylariales sp. PMI_506]|nr:hypothetical protein BX600DRAFT_467503 [Xylariales sp. PMI_506]